MKLDTGEFLDYPVAVKTAAAGVDQDAFLLEAEFCDAFFVRRSTTLFVTFDNLASVAEYDPPQPWLHLRTAQNGFSILGIMAKRKDWYRNPSGAKLLTELRDAGLFQQFERIVFTGTSMGAFAALGFSSIVPGSTVLAFSPQTTLNRDIAPFERRYRYGHRKWDWETPDYLDASTHTTSASKVYVFYDPFVAEDKAHFQRLRGDNIRGIPCGHFGHSLVRTMKAVGALDQIFLDVGNGRFDNQAFRVSLRNRRQARLWQKGLLSHLANRRSPKLALRACDIVSKMDPKFRFPNRIRKQLSNAQPASSPIAEIRNTPATGGQIDFLENALVLPDRAHDRKLASGVLRADGSFCENSRTWIRARKSTTEPELNDVDQVEELPGRHLFAGHLRGHFGHFLVESTARLWAMGEQDAQYDSVLFLPYRGKVNQARAPLKSYQPFFDILGIKTPFHIVTGPVRAEKLAVPELGFGWNERYAGTDAYRSFMRENLGRDIKADGASKLYVSRSKLMALRGGILGEKIIEDTLAECGYEIFHPQKHTLSQQIAKYKAADKIVALDGSALHLAAFLLPKSASVAIIKRRSNANVDDYILQYRSFCGIDPLIIDVIKQDWISGTAKRSDFRSVGELDFPALFAKLSEHGFIPPKTRTPDPGPAQIKELVMGFAERRGDEFVGKPRPV